MIYTRDIPQGGPISLGKPRPIPGKEIRASRFDKRRPQSGPKGDV
jgi:hypothetical protein